jgi:hypothetical protein
VANRERLEAEHRLQLDQVLASGLLTLPVLVPAFDADLELVGDSLSNGGNGGSSADDAGKAQVVHREAQPIGMMERSLSLNAMMRQPFVLFKGLTFQKLCLPGAFRPGITIIKC